MEESLAKSLEGEIINDFKCDGCKKNVDISKRTLISQTPNVLIVHLKRLLFNFDTFRNDKINTYFEFPAYLDLTPYSFYHIMGKENRLRKKKDEDGEEEDEEKEEEEKKDDEENPWPEEEDCFEYKLVGVTVHSGSADSGHYWAYINIKRGQDEPGEDDPEWANTEKDPWMEFNDSRVSEYKFSKLKDDAFGGSKSSSGWGSWSTSYGQSAYMLVYERKKKKPLKVLVTDAEAQKQDGVVHDEANSEYYQLLPYHNLNEVPAGDIYKGVVNNCQSFEFENDIYSHEFFDFVRSIFKNVTEKMKDNTDICALTAKISKKVIMDVVAKCFHNQCIKQMVEEIKEILDIEEGAIIQAFMEECA